MKIACYKRKGILLLSALLLVALLAGCAAAPKVTYQEVTGPDDAGRIKFNLRSTVLVIDKDKHAAGQDFEALTLTTEPAALAKPLYMIVPYPQLFIDTNLQVSYAKGGQGARLVQSLGNEVVDYRQKAIQAAGALIGLGLTLAKALPPEPELRTGESPDKALTLLGDDPGLPLRLTIENYKLIIDNYKNRARADGQQIYDPPWIAIDKAQGWSIKIFLDEFPPDAVDTAAFFTKYSQAPTSVFPFSATRKLVTTFARGGKEKEARPITIWDPEKVLTLAMPLNGGLKFPDNGDDFFPDVQKGSAGTDPATLVKEAATEIKPLLEAIINKK